MWDNGIVSVLTGHESVGVHPAVAIEYCQELEMTGGAKLGKWDEWYNR